MVQQIRDYYASEAKAYDEGLRLFMISVFNNLGSGILLSSIIAYAVSTSPALLAALFGNAILGFAIIFSPLILLLGGMFLVDNMSVNGTRVFYYAFCALQGLALSAVIALYTLNSIVTAFASTAAMFGAMSLYGYTTKRDLTGLGSFLFMGVIGLIIASLFNLFLQSGALGFAISCITVLVFAGLTAFDVQQLKETYYRTAGEDNRSKAGIMGALSLFINFVNIFLALLRIFGQQK